MKTKTIKQSFILSITALLLSILIDQLLLQRPILTKALGIVVPGYLGSVVYYHKQRYNLALFYGFLLGLIVHSFFFLLVPLGLNTPAIEIATKLSSYTFISQLFIYIAAIIIGALTMGFYSLLGALGAKLFWKSKKESKHEK